MARVKERDSQKVVKSQEYVEDSSDSSSEAPGLPDRSKKFTSKVSSSSSDSESENGSKSASGSESESGSESSTSGGTGSESSESEAASTSSNSEKNAGVKRKAEPHKSLQDTASKKPKIRSKPSPNSIKPSMKEPIGYEAIKLGAADFVSETGNMFANLEDKQIWHITVPASVPITSIESLDIQAALRGEPIMHHKGLSYNMFATSSKNEALLLPNGVNSVYGKAKIDVSRHFHLREISHPTAQPQTTNQSQPHSQNGQSIYATEIQNSEYFASQQGTKKSPREQPPGLLMRYQPYGSKVGRNKAYGLPHPDANESQLIETAKKDTFFKPPDYDSETLQSPSKTPKKNKEHKRSKNRGVSRENGISASDGMLVDPTPNGHVPQTPRSQIKTSSREIVASGSKHKKVRKEKH